MVGFFYAYLTKTNYVSKLTFVLDDPQGGNSGFGGALGLASQFGIDLGGGAGDAFTSDNLMELMKSRTMVENTLLSPIPWDRRHALIDLYLDFNKYRAAWKNNARFGNINFLPSTMSIPLSRAQDSVLSLIHQELIKNSLKVEKMNKKSSIIIVTVETRNEVFSKLFTEVLVKQVSNFYIETKTKKSTDNLNILQHQADSVRKMLNLALSGVASSSDANPNPNSAMQVLRVPSQRRQVDVQANQAILTELVKNLEIAKVSLRKETPLIQVLDQPKYPLFKKEPNKIIMALVSSFIFVFAGCAYLILKKIVGD